MDYKNGKIYKILNNIDDNVYIGSTCQSLSERMSKHRWSIKMNRHNGAFGDKVRELGIEQFYIELIEEYPCTSREQLLAKEGYHIRQSGTLNKQVAGRTKQEFRKLWYENNPDYNREYREEHKKEISEQCKIYRETHKDLIYQHGKEYRAANKDSIRESKKQYEEANKDMIRERKKIYWEQNKDKFKEKHKEYRDANKDSAALKAKETITCGCGSCFRYSDKARHERSNKHTNWVESIE